MRRRRPRAAPSLRHETRPIEIPGSSGRLAVVADTHGSLHTAATSLISEIRPDHIVHAGDVGAPRILDELGRIAPFIAVRGNIDPRHLGLADVVTIEVVIGQGACLNILLVHDGLARMRLRPSVRRMAMEKGAELVICGHSHIPWISRDGEVAVLNPGSIGPRRFTLPVTFAVIELTSEGVSLSHIDCETGKRWDPSAHC